MKTKWNKIIAAGAGIGVVLIIVTVLASLVATCLIHHSPATQDARSVLVLKTARDVPAHAAVATGGVSFALPNFRRKKLRKNELKRMKLRRSFTLVELLSAIAIVAILSVALIFFTMSYVQWSQNVSDHKTYTVLSDALVRYQCEGGSLTALTSGAPTAHVIAALKTPVNWAGQVYHQFLQSSQVVVGHSLSATGNGASYHFTAYNTYASEPGGSSPSVQIFLTSGTTWTVPADWNNHGSSIECIGGGGTGAPHATDGNGGSGGGGGAYSKISNLLLTPGNSITYQVGGASADTWFNGASLAASSVGAKGGITPVANAAGGAGGIASSGVGTVKYSGGNGGDYQGSAGSGGGGGAAGPFGNGGSGGTASNSTYNSGGGGGNGGGSSGGNASGDPPTTGGNGGNNFSGSGGGAGAVTTYATAGTNGGGGGGGASVGGHAELRSGTSGGNGTEWDFTHGSGGGGGGIGGSGGLYGGGGSGTNAAGGQGIIVISYTP